MDYLARDDECDGLDARARDLVRARDLALVRVECATGEEAHAALRVGGLVFRKGEEVVVLVLVVTHVAVSAHRRQKLYLPQT